jgi:two-component system response regulator HydG
MSEPRVLIVEDDTAFCNMLQAFLSKKGFEVETAYNYTDAIRLIHNKSYAVVLADVRLPENEGTNLLGEINQKNLPTKVVLMTGYAEVNKAVDAIKGGAFDYISKPVNPEQLLKILNKAVFNLETTPSPVVSKSTSMPVVKKTYVHGVSEASKLLNHYIELVAPTNLSVLITGKSGTGKEYIAQNIHEKSKRSEAPFVPVDCGTIPRELASSEFFGHIKGSFTGAISNKTGHFEIANGGTLFLDEIGNLPYELQVQLLRALQERKIKPVGSSREVEVDIRIIAATNENLSEAVKNGTFREDLYHRLNEFSIEAPSLKDRPEDIDIFAYYFLELSSSQLEKSVTSFAPEVLEAFKKYHWPGNLREMQNIIKRAVLFARNNEIDLLALPPEFVKNASAPPPEESLYHSQYEKERILEALHQAAGNKSKAAQLLQIDRKTLYNKLKRYNISI